MLAVYITLRCSYVLFSAGILVENDNPDFQTSVSRDEISGWSLQTARPALGPHRAPSVDHWESFGKVYRLELILGSALMMSGPVNNPFPQPLRIHNHWKQHLGENVFWSMGPSECWC